MGGNKTLEGILDNAQLTRCGGGKEVGFKNDTDVNSRGWVRIIMPPQTEMGIYGRVLTCWDMFKACLVRC